MRPACDEGATQSLSSALGRNHVTQPGGLPLILRLEADRANRLPRLHLANPYARKRAVELLSQPSDVLRPGDHPPVAGPRARVRIICPQPQSIGITGGGIAQPQGS